MLNNSMNHIKTYIKLYVMVLIPFFHNEKLKGYKSFRANTHVEKHNSGKQSLYAFLIRTLYIRT